MKRILIVEDDLIVGNIYRKKFSNEGYQVEIAKDGFTGLNMVRSYRPDLVLLDLMLPGMDGVELLKKLRAEPGLQKLPVIVFSNAYLSNLVQEAWKAGATKCLSKCNCTANQVIEVVRSLLTPDVEALLGRPAPVNASAPALKPPVPAETASLAVHRAASRDADAEFQADLRKSLIEGLPNALTTLRTLLKGLIKAENELARSEQLHELYRRTHALTGNAGLAGMPHVARMSDNLEALLKELCEQPQKVNASTLRTLASAMEFLGILLEQVAPLERSNAPPLYGLVVEK